VDSTKPHVSGSTEPSTNPTSFTITATDTTPGSGIDNIVGNIYQYKQSQSKYVLLVSHSSSTNNPYTVDLSGLTDGTYYVKYNAHDKSGNVSNTEMFDFTVDHTAPALTINGSTGTDTTPTLTGTTSDATDVVTVDGQLATVDPAANSNSTHNWSITLPSQTVGSHTVTVVSTDTAGNATTETAQVVVTAPVTLTASVTNTPVSPTVTITPNNNQTTTNSTGVLGASTDTPSTTSDNNSDVKGDSTTKNKSDDTKDSSNAFLGLGWWWLLVIAVLAFLWWLLIGRRRNTEN
jgi:hypothetical protein